MNIRNRIVAEGVLGLAAVCAVTTMADEPYARVFLKDSILNNPAYIYDVSEDGLTWTMNRAFCPRQSAWIIRRVERVKDIVYVLEAPANDNEKAEIAAGATGVKGYVYRYKPDGTFIDRYLEFDGCADGMAITRDGRYIIIGNSEGTHQGKLRRYDTVLNEWNHNFGTGFGFMRQMCADDDGFIYIATRGDSGRIYKLRADHSGDAYKPSTCEAKSPAFDLVCAACLNPNGDLYAGGRSGFASFSTNDLTQIINVTNAVPGQAEWSFTSSMIGENMYFASYQKHCVYMVDPVTGLNDRKVTIGTNQTYTAFNISECPTPVNRGWAFDESAGAATCAGGVGLCGARTGATGVRGNSLCLAEEGSFAFLSDSGDMLGSTADFTLTFSVLVPESATNGHYLVSNDAGQSNTLSVVVGPDAADNGKLALVYTPVPGEDPVSIVSDVSIADGKWHHIGVARKDNTTLVLRVDGEIVGTATRDDGFTSSIAWDWHIGSNAKESGGFVPAGTFIDELCLYTYLPPTGKDWDGFVAEAAAATIPSVPEVPAHTAQPLPAVHGTQIFHSFADDAPVASPNVFRSSDGTWYATCERGNSKGSASQVTRIWTSADGAAWTPFGTIKASSVSLFQLPNKTVLHAIGMEGYRKCAVWRYDTEENGETVWTELACATDSENFEIASGEVGFAFNRISRPLIMRDEPYRARQRCGCVFFSYDGSGAFRSGTVYKAGLNLVEQTGEIYGPYSTVKTMYPASTTFSSFDVPGMVTNHVYALTPIVRGIPVGKDFPPTPAGCLRYVYRQWWDSEGDAAGEPITSATENGSGSGVMFPGADKPFMVKYDRVSGVYRMLATPDNKRIEMFESDDFWGWRPCGTVLDAGEGASYSSPSFVIDGDDLVVVYSVGCDDGAGGPRAAAEGNYFACRRVENFRNGFIAEKESLRKLIVCGPYSGSQCGVYFFSRRENGEMFSDKWIAKHEEEFAGEEFRRPRSVDTSGRSIYVACAGDNSYGPSKVRIFSFNRKGEFLRVYSDEGVRGNTVALAVAPDGKNMYVVAGESSNVIHKVDTSTGTWSEFIVSDKLCNVQHMDVGPDGDIYTSNYYNWKSINRWTSEGEHVGTLYSTDDRTTGIAVDDEGKYLYFTTTYGTVRRLELATGDVTMVCSRKFGLVGTGFGVEVFGGKIYVTSTWGWVYAFDEKTLEPVEGAASLFNASGLAGADFDISSGLSITIR